MKTGKCYRCGREFPLAELTVLDWQIHEHLFDCYVCRECELAPAFDFEE
jgi:DNA-directed RNA polymerase subunit RPC12/RpoP